MAAVMRRALWMMMGLLACGGAQTPASQRQEPRPLDEVRFLELFAGVLGEHGLSGQQNRAVRVTGLDRDFEIDCAVAGKSIGVEYVSDADRVVLASTLPAPRPGQLRVLPATDPGNGQPFDVLILEDGDFRYDPNPEQSGGVGPTIQEVEGRLQRDLRDFLHAERQSGNL